MPKRALASILIVIMTLWAPLQVFAQSAPDNANLDLSSTSQTVSSSSLFQGQSSQTATIQVGGSSMDVSAGQLLTPAQFLALSQVLSSGSQSLQLSTDGAAIGGTFSLPGSIASSISSLTIPQNVTGIHDFANNAVFNLSGNFTNSGLFYAVSSNSAITNATVSALNISNLLGASITTNLPGSGIPGFSSMPLVSNLSLSLLATQNILNQGSITSAGNLSLVAGGSITNASSLAGINAVLQATNNLSMQAANIVNSGIMAAQLGNLNVITQQLTNNVMMQSLAGNINVMNSLDPTAGLVVTQANGAVMEALNGAINFNVTDNLLKANMDITGGSLLANELNFNNGDGALNVNLLDAAGAINVNTGIANFAVTQGTHGMNIQSFNITGDPNLVYSGTGAYSSAAFNSLGGYVDIDNSTDTVAGSITFTGTINTTPSSAGSGGYVRLSAGTFISTQAIITSGNTNGNAGNVDLIAQGDITTGNVTMAAGSVSGSRGTMFVQAGLSGTGNVLFGDVAGGSTVASQLRLSAPGTLTTGTFTNMGIRLETGGTIQMTGIVQTIGATHISLKSINGSIIITSTGVTSAGPGSAGGIQLSAINGNISVTGPINASAPAVNPVSLVAINVTVQDNVPLGLLGNISTNNTASSGGADVTIFAEQNITLRNINTSSGAGGGQSGEITIIAGNSGTGNISIQNITATSNVQTNLITVMAPGTVSVGNITANSSNGSVLPISVIAGTSGTSRAPAQSGTLTVGNINSSTAANSHTSGNILLVNMGTNGAISAGTLTVTAVANGSSGGVSIVAHGTVTTGAINTSTSGAGSLGGSVFITSGAAAGAAVTVNGINTQGAGTNDGSLWVIRNAGTSAGLGTVTVGSGGNFNGAPTAPVANIVGNTTLTLTPGAATGYNPGGFTSINAAGSTLTVNTGTAVLPNIPIVARGGDVNIGTLTINNNTANYIPLVLVGAGNLNIATAITNTAGLSSVQLHSTAGSITTPTINLTDTSRILIFASQTFNLANGRSYTAVNSGAGSLINIVVAGGSINLGTANNQTNNALSVSGTIGGTINLYAKNGITLYETSLTANGSTGAAGRIELTTSAGDITLYNLYSTSLGTNFNSTITANSTSAGGGLLLIASGNNMSVVRDISVCCGLSTTQQFSATGSTTDGMFSVNTQFGSINLADTSSGLVNASSQGIIQLFAYDGVSAPSTLSSSNSLTLISYFGTIAMSGTQTATGAYVIDLGSSNGITNLSSPITSGSVGMVQTLGTLNVTSTISSTGAFTATSRTINVSAAGSISALSVAITSENISNSNFIRATGTGAVFTVSSAYNLNLNGTGSYQINNSNNTNAISISAVSGILTINNSPIINAGAGTSATISLNASCATCSIAFGASAVPNLQIANGDVTINSPSITFASGSGITTNQVAGNNLTFTNTVGNQVITVNDAATATITTAGANILFTPLQNLTFAKSAGAGTSTLNLNGGTVTMTMTTGTTLQVSPSVIVQSNRSINFTGLGSMAIDNYGTIRSTLSAGTIAISAAGSISLRSDSSSPGLYQASAGPATISVNTPSIIFLEDEQTFNAPSGVNFTGDSGVSLFQSSNITGTSITITTPLLAVMNAAQLTSGSGITITNTGVVDVQMSSGSSGTITAPSVNFTNNNDVSFTHMGGSPTTLNIVGTLSVAPTNTSGTTISSNFTINATYAAIASHTNRTLTINGNLTSTGPSGVAFYAVSGNNLTVAGTGTIAVTDNNASIRVFGYGSGTAQNVTVDGSLTWSFPIATTSGAIWTASTQLTVETNSIQTIQNGSLTMGSPDILIRGGAVIDSNKTTGVGIRMQLHDTFAIADMQIRGQGNGNSFDVSTAGASIMGSNLNGNITFDRQGITGQTTLNFDGGPVSFTANNYLITGAVTLTSDENITFNVNSGGGFTNNGTVQASSSSGIGDFITIQAPSGNLTMNQYGELSVGSLFTGGGTISILANNGTLTLTNGTLDADSIAPNGDGPTINISALNSIVNNGGSLTINANGTGNGGGGTVNIATLSATADIAIDTSRFRINARGGATSGNGGTVNISAGRSITNMDNAQINIAPQAGDSDGGRLYLTAGTAAVGSITLTAGPTLSGNGLGAGNGGVISLVCQTAGGTLTLAGPTQFTVTGGNSGGSGGTIVVSASNLPTAFTGGGTFTLNADAGTGGGAGGNVTVAATGATGDLNLSGGPVTINARGSAGGAGGNGGIVTISAGRNLTASGANINVSAQAGASSRGGQMFISGGNTAAGTVTFNHSGATLSLNGIGSGQGGTFSLSAVMTGSTLVLNTITTISTNGGASGAGGAITISAPSVPAIAGVVPLTLNAIGSGSAIGGNVSITTTGAAGDIVLGNGDNQLQIIATGGGGGGIVNISAGRALTYGTSAVNVNVTGANGTGGTVNLTASTAAGGNMAINAAISANGVGNGSGGTVTMSQMNAANSITLTGSVVSASKGAGAVAGQTTMSIAGTGAGVVTINNTSSVTSDNISITAVSVTSDGSLTSNLSAGTIFIGSNGALTYSGTGAITASTGVSTITFQANSGAGNILTINGTRAINGSATGNVFFNSTNTGGSIIFGNSSSQLIANGANVTISSRLVTFGTSASIAAGSASDIAFNSGGGAIGLTVRTTTGSSATISTVAGGTITLTPTAGQTLTFGLTAGGTGTLNLNGPVTTTTTTTTTVSDGVTLASNASMLIQTPTLTFGNSASITLSGGASTYTLNSNGGALLTINTPVNATPATVTTAGGAININPATNVTFARPGATGTINLNGGPVTVNSTGTVTVNAGVSVLSNNSITINANNGVITNNGTIASNPAGPGLGSVSFLSTGTLNVTPGIVNVNQAGGNGNGGTIIINASGALTVGTGTLSANANGTGTTGGNITIQGSTLALGGALTLNANGANAGSGGTVLVRTTGVGSITVGAGSLAINANGGATNGQGGDVTIRAGANLTVTGSLSLTPGGNGNGGNLTLIAGDVGAGNLQFTGNVSASASGTGINGGNINISYNNAGAPTLSVGSAAGSNFISGNITANGATTGGDITITNTAAAGNSLTISMTTAASAISAAGNSAANNGLITISKANSPVSITGSAAGNGTIVGRITANGSSVTINPRANNNSIIVQSVTSSAGAIAITANSAGSSVNVIAGSTFQATGGTITVDTVTLTNSQLIRNTTAASSITLTNSTGALTINGTGSVDLTGGGATSIIASSTGANALTFGSSQSFTPGAAGSVAFNSSATGSIVVNASQTIVNGTGFTLSTPTLTLGASTSVTTSAAGTTYTLNSAGATTMTINAPVNATPATLASGGAAININPTTDLVFDKSGATGTLQFTGAAININSNGTVSTTASTTITSDNVLTINLNAGARTLTNNGVIQSSRSNAGNSIIVTSTAGLTVGGTGSFNQAGATKGTTRFAAAAGANTLTFANGTNLSVTGTGATSISAPTIAFTIAGAQTATLSNSGAVTIDGNGGALVINAQGTSTGTISTSGASIAINPATTLSFTQTGAAGTATIAFSGAPTTVTATNTVTVANASTLVSSDNTLTFNVNGSNFTNNGVVRSSLSNAGNTITVASTGSLTLAGTGSFNQTGATRGTTRFSAAAGANTLTFANGANLSVTGTGATSISAPTIAFTTAGVQTATLSNSGAVTIDGNGGALVINTQGTSTGTISTTGASITINPATTLSFTQTGVAGAAVINLNGAPVTVNATNNVSIANASTTLASDDSITFNINGGFAFLNSGTLNSRDSGTGGSVTIQSTNVTTNLSVTAGTINVSSSTGNGDGGTINILATGTLTTVGVANLNASATGTGTTGGNVTVQGSTFTLGGTVNITANGLNAGQGGTVLVQTTGAGSISTGAGNFTISANGGATNGQGGNVTLRAGANLTVNVANVTITPGGNGNGGNLTFIAGDVGAGNLQVTGNASASAAGTGVNGGDVTISYNNAGAPTLSIGSVAGVNYISGNITAVGATLGGDISITNTAAAGNSLTISMTSAGSTISAAGNSAANHGLITISKVNSPVSITGSAAGNGTIVGRIVSDGSSVTINPRANNNAVIVQSITSTAGAIAITANTTGSSVNVFAGSTFSAAGGNINVNTITLTNSQLITTSNAAGSITLTNSTGALTINGAGTVSATGGGATSIIASSTGATALTFGGAQTFTPGAGGTVTFNSVATGSIVVNASQLISNGTGFTVSTPTLTMAAATSLSTSAAPTTITLNSAGAATLTINAPVNATPATIASAGGAIVINPTTNLTFDKFGATGTLQFTGAPVTVNATGTVTTTASTTVTSNNVFTLNVNGGTLTNNGTIISSRVGTPGTVTIQSTSTLVISVLGTITAETSGGGNGGNINIIAASTLSIPFGTISTSATGAGNFNGGITTISSTALTVAGAGALIINSNALGTGNGGTINITASGAAGSITMGGANGNIQAFARGGTVASATGNGGVINVSAGQALTVGSGAFLDVSPRGNNGNGGSITITAGSAAAGNLRWTGALSANGVGTGNGGTINVTYNSAAALDLGAIGVNSYIVGNITADAPGSGNGGIITLTNSAAAALRTTSAGPATNSNITVNSGSGTIGTLNFNKPGQLVDIVAEQVIGRVNSTGTSITINANAANSNVGVNSVTSTAGGIIINATAAGSQIDVGAGGVISAAGGLTATIFLNSPTIINNGLITSDISGSPTSDADIILANVSGVLTLSGNGSFTLPNASTTNDIIAFNSRDTVINGSYTFDTAGNGALGFLGTVVGGGYSLTFNAGTTQTINNTALVAIQAVNLNFENNAAINVTNTAIVFMLNSTAGTNMTVTAPDSGSASISTNGGPIFVSAGIGNNIIFAKSAGAGTGTLNLNGGAVAISAVAPDAITVNANVVLQSNNNITVVSDGSVFTNNGILRTTQAAGSIIVQGTNGFALAGTGSYEATGGGATSITVQLNGAGALNLNTDATFSPGDAGTVNINAQNASAIVSLGTNADIVASGGADLVISTPSLTMGDMSTLTTSGNGSITINSGGSINLTITAPDNGASYITTGAAGAVNLNPTAGHSLIFAKTAGSNWAGINIGGAATATITTDTGITINSNVLVALNINTTFNVNNGVFTNNGNLTSNVVGGNYTITSTGNLTIAGTGSIGHNSGGASSVIIEANAGGANTLTIAGTWFTGGSHSSANVILRSLNTNGSIVFNDNCGIFVNDVTGTFSTPSLTLGNDAVIYWGTSTMNINSGGANPLTITTKDNSGTNVSSLSPTPGMLNISAAAGQNITFAKTAGSNLTFFNTSDTTVTTSGASSIIVNTNFILNSGGNVTVNANGGTFNNSGAVQTNLADGAVTVQSTGALLMNGNGWLLAGGGGMDSSVTVSAGGANALTIDGSPQWDAGVDGTVIVQSAAAGGSIVFNASRTLTVPTSWWVQVISPTLTLNNASQITASGSGQYIDMNSGSLSMTINLPGGAGQSTTIQNTNGVIWIGPYASGSNLSFNAGAASTLNLNASAVETWAINGTTTVAANATIATNGNITMNADGGSINVQGTLQSTLNGGYITFQGWGADLTMGGTPGTVRFTGGAVGTIYLVTQGPGNTINLNSSYTFNPGTNGQLLMTSSNINVANSTTITASNGGSVAITASNLTIGGGASITAGASTGTGLGIAAYDAGIGLTITGTTGSTTGTISTSGSDMILNANSLTFAQTGAGTTTINLNTGSGGTVYTNTNGGNTTINAGVTVLTNSNLDMQVWGGGDLINNGTITSSKNGGSMLITANANFAMSSSGTGTFSMTGSGVNTINVIAYGANFDINNNMLFNAGASGVVTIASTSQNISLANNVTVASTNGSLMNIQTSALNLGDNAVISTTKSTGVGINVYSGTNQTLTITSPSGSSASLLTDGGSIDISSDGAMTFAKSSGANTTLNLGDSNSGLTNINSWNTTTINSGVNVLSAKTMTFNVQRATLDANGQLHTTNGSISLIATTGSLSVGANAVIYANEGNLVIQNADTIGGSITFDTGADIDAFTMSNPALGNVTVFVGGTAGAPVDGPTPANVQVSESGGGQVYFGTNGITANGSTNYLTAKGRNIQFSTGTGPGTLITLAGGVDIMADPPDPIAPITNPTAAVDHLNVSVPSLPVPSNTVIGVDINGNDTTPPSGTTRYDVLGIGAPNYYLNTNNLTSLEFDAQPVNSSSENYNNDASRTEEEDSSLQPISFTSPAASSSLRSIIPEGNAQASTQSQATAAIDLHTVETEAGIFKCTSGTKISIGKNNIVVLKNGEVLVSAGKTTTVKSGDFSVSLEPGTVALVQRTDKILKVRNLCENGSHSIHTVVQRHRQFSIDVAAGQEIVLGDSQTEVQSVLAQDNIGRRKVQYFPIGTGHTLARAEVSPVMVMQKSALLTSLLKSTSVDDQSLKGRMMKMAACLMTVTTSHGAYNAKP